VLPDPAGRAFVALLACAQEGLSARRFAEYLSLGEVPAATAGGAPPPAAAATERWVAPDEEQVPEALAEALGEAAQGSAASDDAATAGAPEPESAPVTAGALRAPRRWEQLLVDAAVIGGRERWERRLAGLAQELRLDLEELDDPEGAEAERIRRTLADLASLRGFALPLLGELAALPERAPWGAWLDRLSALATRALREPARVLAALAELVPMAGVGPVALREVQLVLARRLVNVAVPPPKRRYGRVFVAPAEAARGLAFDVVCVPGLAEKLFPRDIREDPLLLDRRRAALGAGLATNAERLARERLALRLAVGAAARQLVLSYPRLDLEKSRPRVPSFYALEALRAGEGRLPGFDELAGRAERVAEARVGWPAPRRPEDAIDEAEHDLALLESLLRDGAPEAKGTARFLLGANPHLGRALRFRARRWLRSWTRADGLVEPGAPAAEALRAHQLAARSFSATALEHYAACPYRFLLQAVHRLAPRALPEAIDELDPLQRGSLVHEAQFELFGRLEAEGLLPVRPESLERARAVLDAVLDAVAARFRDDLCPAIERVWQDGVASVRADLREWLRRLSLDESGFSPWRFELAFGLPSRRKRDPRSQAGPVPLDCGLRLRGSIDLVERDATGRVRVTDQKTGKARVEEGAVVAGGTALQPVLYALAAEKLFPETEVVEGRLSYCTSTGGFEVRAVPLDARARESARALAEALGRALQDGFLPAFPAERACTYCDYQGVCGPHEELRSQRKRGGPGAAALAALARLRELP
jgi:RecB family exonuclease